jgi:hypothetical protein
MRICPFMRWDILNYTTRAGRVKEGNPFFHHTVFTCRYADIFSSFVTSRAPMDMAVATMIVPRYPMMLWIIPMHFWNSIGLDI